MFQQYRYKAKENQIYPVYDCLNLYQTIHQVKANPECRRQRWNQAAHSSPDHLQTADSLPYSDILFFETGQHNVLLHAISETFTIPGNLTQLTEDFASVVCFLPVGRSYLVNLNHVTGILQHDLIMEDHSIVQIPFRKRDEVSKAVNSWFAKLEKEPTHPGLS